MKRVIFNWQGETHVFYSSRSNAQAACLSSLAKRLGVRKEAVIRYFERKENGVEVEEVKGGNVE